MAEQVILYSTINIYVDGDSATARSPSAGSVGPGTFYKYGSLYTGGYNGNPNVFPISNTDGGSLRGWINLAEDLSATVPSISPSSVTMGNVVTISLPRQRTSITHSLKWRFGDLSGDIGSGFSTSATWTPSTSLATEIPGKEGQLAYIDVTSYENGRNIGTRRGQVSVFVPTSYVPSGTRSLTEAGGLPAGFSGVWVQGKSKLRVSITSAEGVAGSTIRSISTKVGDVVYPHQGTNAVTMELTTAGTIPVVTTFTDTRGRTYSINQSIVVQAYTPPKVDRFWAGRSLSNGTLSENGTFVHASYKYSIASLGGANANTWRIEYKPVGTTSWSTLMSGTGYAVDTYRISSTGVLGTAVAYDVRLTVSDSFASPAITVAINAQGSVMSVRPKGTKGMAVGKTATMDDSFESAWPIIAPDITLAGGSVEDRLAGVWNNSSAAWSDGTQGYFRFPTGHMIIYGYTYQAPSTNYVDVTFNPPFPTRMGSITGNYRINSINPDDYSASNWAAWTVTVTNPSSTGARLMVRAGDDNTPPTGGGYIYWTAFGY